MSILFVVLSILIVYILLVNRERIESSFGTYSNNAFAQPSNIFTILVVLIVLGLYAIFNQFQLTPQQDRLKILLRQAARWSTAASQDSNPIIKLLHANYGAAYLFALQDITTSQEFSALLGSNEQEFRARIVGIQDAATKNMANVCPAVMPDEKFLARISEEGV